MQKIYVIFRNNLELSFWLLAVVLLAFSNPQEEHYSLCLFHHIGLPFCPGCGIGHSISFLFHGRFMDSFHAHPLGVFALVIMLYRIIQLTVLKKSNPYKLTNHG